VLKKLCSELSSLRKTHQSTVLSTMLLWSVVPRTNSRVKFHVLWQINVLFAHAMMLWVKIKTALWVSRTSPTSSRDLSCSNLAVKLSNHSLAAVKRNGKPRQRVRAIISLRTLNQTRGKELNERTTEMLTYAKYFVRIIS